ncbi:XRE family transcriptional regulator [Alcaligenaceae bacterium A4P071]|nr:XRE family transcriptional regulator [Alcaligenaceae bacterium B3P038]MDQ2147407.1 XRE family transcriptional regulator [Alcaligenaceae bacterium C4P045]MDQ2184737.1 XRE family transcriptional regulator [Alcaligenaceae bacterium A4P071]
MSIKSLANARLTDTLERSLVEVEAEHARQIAPGVGRFAGRAAHVLGAFAWMVQDTLRAQRAGRQQHPVISAYRAN